MPREFPIRTFIKKAARWIRHPKFSNSDSSTYNGEPFIDAALTNRFPQKKIAKFSNTGSQFILPIDVSGDIIVQAMKKGELFEPEIVAVGAKYIKPATVVLDIGSNLGQMGIEFSKLTGPNGKVHCFEANDFVFELLSRNLKLNGADNAIPHFCAVWNKSGEELIFPDPDFQRFGSYGSYGIDPKAKTGKKVMTQSIDDLGITEKVSFIKVDIQGSDLFALQGAKQLIARDKPIIIFEFEKQFQKEFGTSFKDYQNFIQEINYQVIETINKINFVIGPK